MGVLRHVLPRSELDRTAKCQYIGQRDLLTVTDVLFFWHATCDETLCCVGRRLRIGGFIVVESYNMWCNWCHMCVFIVIEMHGLPRAIWALAVAGLIGGELSHSGENSQK